MNNPTNHLPDRIRLWLLPIDGQSGTRPFIDITRPTIKEPLLAPSLGDSTTIKRRPVSCQQQDSVDDVTKAKEENKSSQESRQVMAEHSTEGTPNSSAKKPFSVKLVLHLGRSKKEKSSPIITKEQPVSCQQQDLADDITKAKKNKSSQESRQVMAEHSTEGTPNSSTKKPFSVRLVLHLGRREKEEFESIAVKRQFIPSQEQVSANSSIESIKK